MELAAWEPLLTKLIDTINAHEGLKGAERKRLRKWMEDANNKPMAFKMKALLTRYWPHIKEVTNLTLDAFDKMVIQNRNRIAHNNYQGKKFILAGTRSFHYTSEIIGLVATMELFKLLGLNLGADEAETLQTYLRGFFVDQQDVVDDLTFGSGTHHS